MDGTNENLFYEPIDLSEFSNEDILAEIMMRLANGSEIPLSNYSSFSLLRELQSVNRKDVRIASILDIGDNECVYTIVLKVPKE